MNDPQDRTLRPLSTKPETEELQCVWREGCTNPERCRESGCCTAKVEQTQSVPQETLEQVTSRLLAMPDDQFDQKMKEAGSDVYAPPPSEGGGTGASVIEHFDSTGWGTEIHAPTCASLRSGTGEAGSWTVEGEMGSAGKSVPLDVLRAKFARDVESDSIVGSCGCMTKTPEVKYHKPACKYRIISERDEAREQLTALQHALGEARAERDKLKTWVENHLKEVGDVRRELDERKQGYEEAYKQNEQLNTSLATLTRERDDWKALAAKNTGALAFVEVERDSALTCLHTLAGALEEIALDTYPETDAHGCCLECGEWTPRNHAEAHEHKDTCQANIKYQNRRNPRLIATAALATYSRLSQGAERK